MDNSQPQRVQSWGKSPRVIAGTSRAPGSGTGRLSRPVAANGTTGIRIHPRSVSGPARALRGAARPAAAPHQEARGQHLRHSDRGHHAAVPRLHRPDAGDEPRRRGGVPGHGGDAHPHQVAAAAAARRPDAGRSGRGSARGAGAPAPGAPEVQGGRRAAARAGDAAQRAVDAARRPDRRDCRRGAGARDRGRSLQPDRGVPLGRRAREAAAQGLPAGRADPDRGSHRAAA